MSELLAALEVLNGFEFVLAEAGYLKILELIDPIHLLNHVIFFMKLFLLILRTFK